MTYSMIYGMTIRTPLWYWIVHFCVFFSFFHHDMTFSNILPNWLVRTKCWEPKNRGGLTVGNGIYKPFLQRNESRSCNVSENGSERWHCSPPRLPRKTHHRRPLIVFTYVGLRRKTLRGNAVEIVSLPKNLAIVDTCRAIIFTVFLLNLFLCRFYRPYIYILNEMLYIWTES